MWAGVLAERVDEAGRIDFEGLRGEPEALERFVAWVAQHGPETRPELFPRPEQRIAYYVNAYNALAMYNAVHSGVLPKSKARFFWARELALDGRQVSLYDLENDVIRPLGDARVHFALNCMVRGCPRLPRYPFRGETLQLHLKTASQEFFNDEEHLRIDDEKKRVYVSSILNFYTEDFVRSGKVADLPAYINLYRKRPNRETK